jgi:adenine-specific DNA methylase
VANGRRLVEAEAGIPDIDRIDEAAAKEKTGAARAPISEVAFWWTRKPLVASRAVVLASLVDEDFPRERFLRALGLGERSPHEQDPPGDLVRELNERARREGISLLDPFAGGGSIPFEAVRLGVPAVALEYNPVAWLLLKFLEWSKAYGAKLLDPYKYRDVRGRLRRGFGLDAEKLCALPDPELEELGDLAYWGCWVLRRVRDEVAPLHPEYDGRRVAAYIWLRQVRCPRCGAWVPLSKDFSLSEKRKIVFDIEYEGDDYEVKVVEGGSPREPTVNRGVATCPKCGHVISNDYIKEGWKGNDRLAVLVLEGKDYVPAPRGYRIPEVEIREELVPDEDIAPNDPRRLPIVGYGVRRFGELFNRRQLAALAALSRAIVDAREEMLRRGYDAERANAVSGILSILLIKHADRNSSFTSWDSSYEVVSHTLAFRGIGLTWNYVEVNPFANSSGSLWGTFGDLLDGAAYAIEKLGRSPAELRVVFGSALRLPSKFPDGSVKLVVTDPPYYDDVPYAELSDFYYVWLKRVLSGAFPEQLQFYTLWRDRSDEELSVGGYRDERTFSVNLDAALRGLRRILSDDGLLVLFFAHSSVEAWAHIVDALSGAGFRVESATPLRTESSESATSRGKFSMESSIVLACRPRPKGAQPVYLETIIDRIREGIREAVGKAWDSGYRGADLLVAAYGAALRELTQYSEIRSMGGGGGARSAVELVERELPRAVVGDVLKLSSVDPETGLYVYIRTVREYYHRAGSGFSILLSSDELLNLQRAFNADMMSAGLAEKAAGARGKVVRIRTYRERGEAMARSRELTRIIDAVHAALHEFEGGGLDRLNSFLSRANFSGFTREDVERVLEAIARNSAEDDAESKEARKLLDALGRGGLTKKGGGLDAYMEMGEG